MFRVTTVFVCGLCSLPTQAEQAVQPLVEEIVVTADFRAAGILDYAASASVIDPNQTGTVVNHLEEILNRAPNVNFAAGASRGRFVQIRGIGERGQFDEPINSAVGLIIDGVDMSGIGGAATLYDVEQVEILRGPQGTLYGANALAGLINLVTPDPTETHTASVQLDGGDFGAFGLGGVVSGPLGKQTGYRLSARRYRDDGFIDNDFLGRDNTTNRDETTIRGKVNWRGESTAVQVSFGRIDIDNGYDAFSLDNVRTTLSDQPGQDQQLTHYGSVKLDWDISDAVALEASIGFADSDIDYGFDEDWTFVGFDPDEYSSFDRYERERQTLNADFRLISQPGAELLDGRLSWVAGIYTLQQDVDLDRTYTFLDDVFSTEFSISRVALYGELTYDLSDLSRLTVGLRAEQHNSDYDDSNSVSFDPRDNLLGGRILYERDLAGGALFYAGVTRGYRAGGFNQSGTLSAELREFDPEFLWNVELGYKASLVDGRLNLRAALFRQERRDVQIATSITREIDGQDNVEFIQLTDNAAEGFNQGIELELDYALTERWQLYANVGWLDTEYKNFFDATGRDLDGREQAHAPSYSFFTGALYEFAPGWTLELQLEGKDAFFFSDSHDVESDAYELVNASLTYQAERFSVRLWGRNLGDEDVLVRGFLFGNDPRDGYTTRPFTQLGEPRQFGVSITSKL